MSDRKEFNLKIAIGGRVDPSLNESIKSINDNIKGMGGTIKSLAAIAASGFAAMQIKDFAQECVEQSRQIETSMAGVAKVVDGLKDENGKLTDSYYAMEDSIISMSKEMPMMATEIAEIMEAAGQANIPADDLEEFTETAVKMGIAFDSTAEQAGEWMAAWRTALHLSQEEVTELSDKINYLGNTSSEDAVKLSEIVTDIGSLGAIAGMTGDTVAAMGAAMTKVDASVASTGIKNMIKAFTAGESATKRQSKGFSKLGMDAEVVSKAMQIDSQGTILDILEGITKLDASEQSATISNIFGNESKQAIAPLIENLDNLKEQFQKVGDSALYAGSMENEYLTASSTSANLDVLTENKLTAMQKEVGDTLVPLADEFNIVKGQIFDGISEFVTVNAPELREGIQGIVEKIETGFPTVLYKIKEFGRGIADFGETIASAIKQVIEHSELFIGSAVAIGGTIKGYKIASEAGKFAKGLMDAAKGAKKAGGPLKDLSLVVSNPWALGITAVATGFMGLATAVKIAGEKAKAADLKERFGDVALSLEEIDEAAENILKDNNIEKLQESMNLKEKMEELQGSLKTSVKEMEKASWKVSIGIELSEEDKSKYKSSVESFISESQELLDTQQYKIGLAFEILTGEKDEGMDDVFASYRTELNELSQNMREALEEALKDGIIDLNEAELIEEYQKKISSINETLADTKYKAELKVLQEDALNSDLTPESFQNVLAKTDEIIAERKKEYEENRVSAVQAQEIKLAEGTISQEEYNKKIESITNGYNEAVTALQLDKFNFGMDTVKNAFPQEFDALKAYVEEYIQNADWTNLNTLKAIDPLDFFIEQDMDHETSENLSAFFKQFLPSFEQQQEILTEYRENGKAMPKGLAEGFQSGMEDMAILGALAGDVDSMYMMVGQSIAGSPKKASIFKEAEKSGLNINEGIAQGIEQNKYLLDLKTDEMHERVKRRLNLKFRAGFSLSTPVNLKLIEKIGESAKGNAYSGKKIESHATGGIVTHPVLTTFAEEGPEAAIPLDGSRNAINLWTTAGKMLGVIGNNSTSLSDNAQLNYNKLSQSAGTGTGSIQPQETIQVTYAPTINAQGAAGKEEVIKALKISEHEFETMLERVIQKKKRIGMGGYALT